MGFGGVIDDVVIVMCDIRSPLRPPFLCLCLSVSPSIPLLIHRAAPSDTSSSSSSNQKQVYSCDYPHSHRVCTNSSYLKNDHTGWKPFHCPWDSCRSAFQNSDELTQHYQQHFMYANCSLSLTTSAFLCLSLSLSPSLTHSLTLSFSLSIFFPDTKLLSLQK